MKESEQEPVSHHVENEAEKVAASGPLAWMARNTVAANLLMAALILGGIMMLFSGRIKQEVFPEFALDVVTVSVAYPGASPSEVERAVTTTIEEAVRGVDGVKEVSSTSSESGASVVVRLLLNANKDRALADIKAAVDRITTFPQDAERAVTSLVAFRNRVVSLVLYGDASEKALRALAERTRDELLQNKNITVVELAGVRPLEISVEVDREKLREYGLTLAQVASAIRAANVELPAGGIKTDTGEILLRTKQRRDYGRDFGSIAVRSMADGTQLKLSDIARIDDSFADTDQEAWFNGKRAAMVQVFRVGSETPITVSDSVRQYVKDHAESLPGGVKLSVWDDRSVMFRERIDLLMRNARLGLLLVLFSLGLFLEIRLAFWVTMGIPISFLGALLFLPNGNISINMISLFAFLVTLGIVVDDAIVVGEAVYKRQRDGLPLGKAAVAGVRDVATPVIFSVLTTIVAFSPLLFVPGTMGKFFRNIPVVVILVLAISLLESLLVLPAHLSHENPIAAFMRRMVAGVFGKNLGPFGWVARQQQRFSAWVEGKIEDSFVPGLNVVVRNRYISLAVGFAVLVASFGLIAGGRINFTFMPKIQMDVVFAQLEMPYGTPVSQSKTHMLRMVKAAEDVLAQHGGFEKNARGIFSQVGASNFGGMGGPGRRGGGAGSHVSEIAVLMVSMDQRSITARDFSDKWRDRIGDVPGADKLRFRFTSGASAEAPISIRLSHTNVKKLERAAGQLAARIRGFAGVKDIDDGVSLGKTQFDFELKPEARALGITEVDLARQVRASFFGAEASRQQRGRDEIRVYVRLPKDQRKSVFDLESLLIRTPSGGEVPLGVAARIKRGRAYTQIKREDGRRTITVEGDVVEGKANANKIMSELKRDAIPPLMASYPGLQWSLGGQQRAQADSLKSLGTGFLMALIVMFALMAIPFKSYSQPLIIMTSIPFGIVGAIGGHLLMGYDLSILSMMGLVALSGVVVNDSLVLISAINDFRAKGSGLVEAVVAGGARRFRPIILTSLTTFVGLAPMIFETSMQARFLIPMALSLGFGVLFATVIVLLLVPCIYLVLEDIKSFFARWGGEDVAVSAPSAE